MNEQRTFNVLFSIPQIDSAFMRNPAGGGRLKIDVEQSTVDQVNAMLDEAVKRSGVTFAAVVVLVGVEESLSNGSPETHNRTAGRAPTMARRRIQRPTD